jgi:DNA-binding response OmpR family regulator
VIRPAKVLIIDDELGFVAWLGVTLAANGYATIPATSLSAAKQLIEELNANPDLAVMNLELAGTIELIETLRRANLALKIIAIEDTTPLARTIEVDGMHSRSEADWLMTVERVLDLRNASGAS